MRIEIRPGLLIGEGAPLALIAGPCVIEREDHVHFLARRILDIAGPYVALLLLTSWLAYLCLSEFSGLMGLVKRSALRGSS